MRLKLTTDVKFLGKRRQEIANYNGIAPPYIIFVGQRIKVPASVE
ncbi:MAG: hypothetical protein DRR08_13655 [Candidatus Parabeggiatoa sp. nov. 2]|nr:MAG: hypothetical protein B6247_29485 [Beggiatoa sp. 4572_84]RKZ59560.1 MAG: hypothetical protein DRR08_13655 [Gammaproteobacteria bacterium]